MNERHGCLLAMATWLVGGAGLLVATFAYGRTSPWGGLLGAWLVAGPGGWVAWDLGTDLGGTWKATVRLGCGLLVLLLALIIGSCLTWTGPPTIAV